MKGAGRGTGRPCRDARRGASQHGLRSMVDKDGREGFEALDGREQQWRVVPGKGNAAASVVMGGGKDAEPK